MTSPFSDITIVTLAKMKVTLRLLFLLILISSWVAVFPQTHYASDLKWSKINIPSEGVGGYWALAPGSDVRHLTQASDGTLYCYANPAATSYRLFKSIDGGSRWSYTGRVEDSIVDIAVLRDNPKLVYYATFSGVFKSSDGGTTFTLLAANPGGSGLGNIQITSLDVACADGINYVAIGTRDADAAEFGGVYTLKEAQSLSWEYCNLGTYDICKVAFSPRFDTDRQLTAIGTDESDVVISSGTFEGGWSLMAGEARVAGLTPFSADIAFPDDYHSTVSSGLFTQFISLNSGRNQGGVYCLKGQNTGHSMITKLNEGGKPFTDVASMALSGKANGATLLVGAADTSLTFVSEDSGANWSSALKPLTGNSVTGVVMAEDFSRGGPSYAVTSGAESAFSTSRDRGASWNQTALIDTRISAILDLAIAPGHTQPTGLFLLTADIQNSLWHSGDDGVNWQRIYCTSAGLSDRFNLVLLSPNYHQNGELLLAGTSQGNPVIWKSTNKGRTFIQYESLDPNTGKPVNIDTWTITPGDVLFVGSFDGDISSVYQTEANSLAYIDRGKAGKHILNSLVLSPGYMDDHTLLAGNCYGGIFFSNDNGLVFESLPFNVTAPPLLGNISVAFDSGYSQNNTLYAADDTADRGIFRFVMGKSSSWQSIDTSLPVQARIGQVVISREGVLYGVNLQTVATNHIKGGIERCLNPSASNPFFETFTGELESGINLKIIRTEQNRLWTVDAVNNKLLTCTDTLVAPPKLVAPPDGAASLEANTVNIVWEQMDGASSYHWQIDTDTHFLNLANKWEGVTDTPQIRLTNLNADTTYYWRVRANKPLLSPWSAVRSFNTLNIRAPTLSQPGFNAAASLKPVFKWSISPGADQYQLRVSRDDQFTDLVIDRFCGANLWQSDLALANKTSYYWKVRALIGPHAGGWSAIGIFTAIAETTSAPISAPRLNSPKPGSPVSSSSAEIEPVFKWSSVEGASHYELVISPNDTFSHLIVNQICYANAWKCDTLLDYGSAYYWKVKAVSDEIHSEWSDVNVFTTRSAPVSASPASSGTASRNDSPTPTSTPKTTPGVMPAAAPSTTPSTTPKDTSAAVVKTVVTTPVTAVPGGAIASKSDTDVSVTGSAYQTPKPGPGAPPDLTPAPAVTITQSAAGSANSWLIFLFGGLTVLTTITIAVMVFLLKKFLPG